MISFIQVHILSFVVIESFKTDDDFPKCILLYPMYFYHWQYLIITVKTLLTLCSSFHLA